MKNISLTDFCSYMGFGEKELELLKPLWSELVTESSALQSFFISEEFFRKYYSLCEGPQEVWEKASFVIEKVKNDPVLILYAKMLHYGLYLAEPQMPLRYLPLPEKLLGKDAGIFMLMTALSALPIVKKKYDELQVEESIYLALCKGMGVIVSRYMLSHENIPGCGTNIHWFRHHADGRLFRLGRLEFMTELWRTIHPAAYRNKNTSEVCLLCQNDWMFDKEGLLVTKKKNAVFTSRLYTEEGKVCGTPFDKEGYPIMDKLVTLELSQWQSVASPWDLVLDVHIPGGAKLSMEECRRSFIMAKEFFSKIFKMEVKAFRCGSWILNPDFAREMPYSNIAKFQKNVHLGPISASPGNGIVFVYGDAKADPLKLPATTSVHRAFRKFAEKNIVLKNGMMTLLADEAESFGLEE